jgi:hypothetical protein
MAGRRIAGAFDPGGGFLKYDSQPPPADPDRPAALLGGAKYQFKSIGQLDLRVYLKACAAGGIVNNPAIDDRGFRVND